MRNRRKKLRKGVTCYWGEMTGVLGIRGEGRGAFIGKCWGSSESIVSKRKKRDVKRERFRTLP